MLFVFLLCTAASWGQDLTVDKIREEALAHSSLLQAQELEAQALRFDVQTQSRLSNPQIMGQFGILRTGTSRGSTSEISLTQAVPLSGKLSLRKEMAGLALSQQQQQSEYFKRWITHEALLSAWHVHVKDELFAHGKERIKRLGLIKTSLSVRPQVTPRQRAELTIIESQLLQLERGQDEKAMALELALNGLSFWLGREVRSNSMAFSIPVSIPNPTPGEFKIEKDPEFMRAKSSLQLLGLEASLARSQRRPDLFLGGGHRLENVAPVNEFSYAIVGITIPIWDTGTSQVEASAARVRREKFLFEDMERRLQRKHQDQFILVTHSHRQAQRFSQGLVRKQERSIEQAEEAFKRGQIDINTFLQLEAQAHETIDMVYLAWLEYLEQLSALQLLRGESFDWGNL